MSDDLSDPLYRRELLRLAANATGAGHLPAADATASVHNPACGDRVRVELALEGGRIAAMAHVTHGCVLTQASAALLAGMAAGKDQAGLTALDCHSKANPAGALWSSSEPMWSMAKTHPAVKCWCRRC